jgi:excisionase family DNA binding protein
MRGQGGRSQVGSLQKLLTVPEVAGLLGVKPSTVYAWVGLGKLPCVRIGALIRFQSDDLLRWIGQRKED